MKKENKRILILGAGLAGLGASIHLKRAGYEPVILEKSDRPGGMFTNYSIDDCDFDYGPKILILDDSENSREIRSYLGANIEKYPIQESVYLTKYGLLRFPLQRYLIELPKEERERAIASLQKEQENPQPILNFKDWLIHHYGEYFAHLILIPYEQKKWRINLEDMDYHWALNRPVKVSLEEVIAGSKTYLPPNSWYYYPKKGNIATLTDEMVRHAGQIYYNKEVTEICLEERYVIAGGTRYDYDILVSTLPLDQAVENTSDLPEKYKAYSSLMLTRLSIVVFNLVYSGNYDLTGTAIYFPEEAFVFRRVSVLQNLCPALGRTGKTAITVEVSLDKPLKSYAGLYKKVVNDLKKIDQFAKMGDPVKHEAKDVPFAYPKQIRGHSFHVADLHRYYAGKNVYHCGRGGTYNYCNGDLAYKQGTDVAQKIVNYFNYSETMEKRSFTVGIPSYNSGKSIIYTVQSIRNSQDVRSDFPIIVSVDGPTLKPEIQRELEKLNVTVVQNKVREGQTARNQQIMQMTTTDILILTQDDVLFKPQTIKNILKAFTDDQQLTMLSPLVVPLSAETITESAVQRGVHMMQSIAMKWNDGDNYLSSVGRCLAFRTDIVQKFNVPKNVINCDAYYYFENKRLSGKFTYLTEAEVNYRSPQTMDDHLKQVRKFVISERELTSYLQMDLREDYKPPRKYVLRSLISEWILHPTLTTYYIILSLLVRFKAKDYHKEATHLWEVDQSTKNLT